MFSNFLYSSAFEISFAFPEGIAFIFRNMVLFWIFFPMYFRVVTANEFNVRDGDANYSYLIGRRIFEYLKASIKMYWHIY